MQGLLDPLGPCSVEFDQAFYCAWIVVHTIRPDQGLSVDLVVWLCRLSPYLVYLVHIA